MRAPLMKRMDLGIPWTKETSGDYCEQCGSFHQCQEQQQSHSADLLEQILTHSSHKLMVALLQDLRHVMIVYIYKYEIICYLHIVNNTSTESLNNRLNI